MAYCPSCKGLLRPERGTLVCLHCTKEGRARTVLALGKKIFLGKGQQGLAAPSPASAFDGPLKPKAATWKPATSGPSGPHPQLALFPHDELRDGQRRLARDVAMAVQGGKHLVAQAPTGIGKTAAALAPALEEAIRSKKTVLFLTSRQSQHRIAIETLRRIREKRGVRFSVVDLVAKRDMCLRREAADLHPARFPDFCSRETRAKTCQFIRAVPKDALHQVADGVLHVEELMAVGKGHNLCPHLLALEASQGAQVVVADYNHLFSDLRELSLQRFGLKMEDIILVVDEAHNLPERVRQNHSHRVTPFLLDQVEGEVRGLNMKELSSDIAVLRAVLARFADASLEAPPEGMTAVYPGAAPGQTLAPAQAVNAQRARPDLDGRGHRLRIETQELVDAFAASRSRLQVGHARGLPQMAEDLGKVTQKLKKEAAAVVHSEELLEAIQDWTRFGDGALRYLRWEGTPLNGVELHVRLLDPSLASRDVFTRMHSAILMSGTLRPPEVVRDILGLQPDRTLVRSYPSPFPQENRFIVVSRGLSTRFGGRSDELWNRYADTIARTAAACKGNLAVFTPSYQLLRDIRAALKGRLGKKEEIVEDPSWGKSERDAILDQLAGAKRRDGAILLGVLGGSFSEGVDFAGNLLSSVIVVGLPLAPPDLEVEAMVAMLERRLPGKGRLYGYTVPAMTKVVQAMGRGLRSPTDKCAILLLDERFLQPQYRQLLPDEAPIRAVDDAAATVTPFLQAHGL